jgi:hypothetical protein
MPPIPPPLEDDEVDDDDDEDDDDVSAPPEPIWLRSTPATSSQPDARVKIPAMLSTVPVKKVEWSTFMSSSIR